MSGVGRPRHRAVEAALMVGATMSLLSGCAGSTVAPNSASNASVVPGAAPVLGEGSQGSISVTGTMIQRTGVRLTITAQIHNSGSTADQLLHIGSQVSPTLTLTPPLQVPAGATRELGGANGSAVLQQEARLEPGGTVDLTLQFRRAGLLEVFSSFH